MGDETPDWLRTQLLGCVHSSLFRILCRITLQEWSSWVKKRFAANTSEFLPKIENSICFSSTTSSFFYVDFSILFKIQSAW